MTNSLNRDFPEDEKYVLEQLSKGDREMYAKVYSYYVPRLLHFVAAFTKSREDAEEIVQEVFLKIWQRKESLVGVRSFEAYMFSMAKHLVFDWSRRRKLFNSILVSRSSAPESDNSLFESVIYKEYTNVAIKAIDSLSPQRRKIYQLRVHQGLKLAEIANELNLSVPGVKKNIYEALDFIKEYMRQNGDWLVVLILILQKKI